MALAQGVGNAQSKADTNAQAQADADTKPDAQREKKQAHTETAAFGEKLGAVHFPTSCNQAARPRLERGLALLHHMTYEGARAAFGDATRADPDCAMGYWGQAMTYIHPIWSDPPNEKDFENGRRVVQEAKARGKKTAHEEAYIAAVEAYYKEGRNPDEKKNLTGFEKAWAAVRHQFPDDLEATAFFALAHLATADPDDKTYAVQKRAGALAEEVLSKEPNHPGGNHYLIHAYDYPPLANQALTVARHYSEIAPEVPHALHMPTHIFTRLGLWEESIALNKRSAAAAHEHTAGDQVSLHFQHALDYLAYAYLQRGEVDKAREIAATLAAADGPYQIQMAVPYTLAAVPARLALERQQWKQAAALEARKPASFPWDQYPAIEAITHFARALGAAHDGDAAATRRSIEKLAALRDEAAKTSDYWAKQVEIQRLAANAWLAFGEDRKDEALKTMRHAAELEGSTEKHPVTPGEVLPAQELYADMLLEMGRYAEARAAYEGALVRSPNRLNALYGAGRAAELAGQPADAAHFYSKLIEITAPAADLPRIQHAREFLSRG